MFMHHVAMFGELPFKPSIPNKETLETFKKTDAGQDLTRHNSVGDIFDKLDT
jgi:antitoxin component of RelBE/YafQ-DinJ toxin-antitoxin module